MSHNARGAVYGLVGQCPRNGGGVEHMAPRIPRFEQCRGGARLNSAHLACITRTPIDLRYGGGSPCGLM